MRLATTRPFFGLTAVLLSASWVLGLSAVPVLASQASTPRSSLQGQETSNESPKGDTFAYSIVTAPPLEGIEVELDGVIKRTGADGTTTFEVPRVGVRPDPNVAERVIVKTTELDIDPQTRATFSLVRPRGTSLAIQYTISYLVSFRFRDSAGERIPASSLDHLLLKSSVGEELEIEPGKPVWLLGTRAAPAPDSKFDIKQVFWTVQDVMVDGLSVANRSQTKFYPEEMNDIEVPLLFFTARFEVVDAFFKSPIGDSVELVSPAGLPTIHELDTDGKLTLTQLARGEYTVLVHGPGLEIARPVAVSRNQTVQLKLYSWLDVGLVAVTMLLFFAIPLAYGVRRRRRFAPLAKLAYTDDLLPTGAPEMGGAPEASPLGTDWRIGGRR